MIDDDALALTAGRDMWSTHRSGDAPSVRMADGPMGIASGRVDERDISVLTPSGVAMGASWDRLLVAKVGTIVGTEAKRLGVDLILAPNLNLARTPNAGRAFEMFGEDPLLAGELGAAWIGGVQSCRVGSVAKHLVCNDTETQRDRYDAIVDETTLREIYLMPFEFAVRAGCAGLLAAYNKLNGEYCAQNGHILSRVVREDWRFAGFTVSDWFGTHAGAASINAGLDLEMPGPARFMGEKLRDAVTAGEVTAARVAEAGKRVLDAARRWSGPAPAAPGENRDAVLAEAAAAGFVLLRNRGDLLPLVPASIRRLAVIGPNAIAPCFQGGTFARIALRPDATLPIPALAARFGEETVRFAPGCPPAYRLPPMPATPARDLGDGCARGMTIEYFADHDFTVLLGDETRDTNSLTWFHGMHDLGAFERPGGIRASGRITPTVSGTHRFFIGGTGSVRLRIDGREVLAAERYIPAADVMGALKSGDSEFVETVLEANVPVLVEAELRYTPARAHGLWFGVDAPRDAGAMLAEAVAIARDADAVLLLVGETADAGVESKDRETTALPLEQQALVSHVIAANPNTIVAVNVGHAFDPGFAQGAAALLCVWYPGEAFGPALAAVLAGDLEPSGRLPLALAAVEADYPALHAAPGTDGRLPYAERLGIGYRGMAERGRQPAFGFGEGLGYGRFVFESARAMATAEGGLDCRIMVRNIGRRAAAAVAQVYREDDGLALLGFAKQVITPGDAAEILVAVDPIAMRRWRGDGWQPPTGRFRIGVGPSSLDRPLMIEIDLG